MANQRRCNLMIVAFTLSALVLGGNVFHDHSGLASQGANPMNVTRITVDHVHVAADKPFDQVSKAFEEQLGQFKPEVYKSLATGEDAEKARDTAASSTCRPPTAGPVARARLFMLPASTRWRV